MDAIKDLQTDRNMHRQLTQTGRERWAGSTGGDLEGLGDGPQNLRWEDGPCIRPPDILRANVIGCEAKYEPTLKGS